MAREDRGRAPAARVRRTAEEARRVILDAAEKRLREGGPDAIRLQDIARDVGIAHTTILHHFESRDGLTEALQVRAMERLQQELIEVLETENADVQATTLGALERAFATLGDAGHARLLAWRALDSAGPDERDAEAPMLRDLTDRVHRHRLELRSESGLDAVDREDSEFIVRLATAALLGDGIFGPFIDAMTGHDGDSDVGRRFRVWLAQLLLEHVSRAE